MVLEICIDSIESVKNAVNGKASRLEICSSLSEGGLTPSLGLINFTKQYTNIPIYSMIRIRSGNFNYTQDEMDAMIYDLKLLKNHNVDGFVFGALDENNKIQKEYCHKIVEAARPKPVTFHRAFDEVDEPFIALNEIINLGFERILTSGKKNTAIEGIELIKQLVDKADDKIIIMPGSGITCDNISLIKNSTGAKEFHASAKVPVDNRNTKNSIKIGDNIDKPIMITNEKIVKQLIDILNNE